MVEMFFRYALLIGVALTVLSATFWLLRAATEQILGESRSVLMPFQVIGKDDPSGKLGQTLAQMLIARVGRIEQEMETSTQALKVAKSITVAPSGAQLMDINPDRALTIPEQIFEPLDLKLFTWRSGGGPSYIVVPSAFFGGSRISGID
ncbi:hypothetical protein [Nitrospira sp. Nam80]